MRLMRVATHIRRGSKPETPQRRNRSVGVVSVFCFGFYARQAVLHISFLSINLCVCVYTDIHI